MKDSYSSLVTAIVQAVRKKAQEIPKFRIERNGAIRILAYPLCKEADDWLGGLSNFSAAKPDIVDYEHTFAITQGGSRVIKTVENGIKKKVDCYAYSALKIAHCSLAQDMQVGLTSGLKLSVSNLTEEYGYAPYRGALCVEVKKSNGPPHSYDPRFCQNTDYCMIYVCVSGAEQIEDQSCATVAVPVIEKFFTEEQDGIYSFVYDTIF